MVVFVDHDPRRLAGHLARHLEISPGGTLAETAPPVLPAGLPPTGRVAIEVAGYGGPLAGLAGLAGVAAVSPSPAGLEVLVDPGCSDDVLRHLLAGKRAHVVAVRPAPPGDGS